MNVGNQKSVIIYNHDILDDSISFYKNHTLDGKSKSSYITRSLKTIFTFQAKFQIIYHGNIENNIYNTKSKWQTNPHHVMTDIECNINCNRYYE